MSTSKRSGKNTERDDSDLDEEVETNEDGEEAPQEKKGRHKPTIQEHISHYEQLFSILDTEIDRRRKEKDKGTRAFRVVRKVLRQMRKEVPHVTRSKEARMISSMRTPGNSGLMMKFPISEELRKFLGLDSGERISRIEATRAICVYAHLKDDEKRESMLRWKHLNPKGKRDLQNPDDKKSILPDKALSKLLRYEEYRKAISKGQVVKKVKDRVSGRTSVVKLDSPELFYWAIQRLLNPHFLKDDLLEVEDSEEEKPKKKTKKPKKKSRDEEDE